MAYGSNGPGRWVKGVRVAALEKKACDGLLPVLAPWGKRESAGKGQSGDPGVPLGEGSIACFGTQGGAAGW